MAGPGYHFLVCPDAELINQRLEKLLSATGAPKTERKVYWGDEDLPQAFWQDLTIKSLFDSHKTLIVRRAHSFKVEVWDKLTQGVKNCGSSVLPIFCLEGAWNKNKAPVPAALTKRDIWKKAEKNGWIWQSPGLTAREIRGFVSAWAEKNGLKFGPGGLEALCRALPLDAAHARLELGKIELAAGDGKTILPEHSELISPHQEMDFFDFMDALSKGGSARAVWQRVMNNHSESDSMLFLLIGYLARESRLLWDLCLNNGQGVKMHPYVKKLKTPLAKRLGPERISRLISLAFDAELSVKSGEQRPEQALDMLVADLSRLFGSPPPGRRN